MEIHTAIRKLGMQQSPDCNLNDSAEAKRIGLLRRAKNVLTSARLKREYDSKRAQMKKISSAPISRQNSYDNTTYQDWIDSCADAVGQQVSISDLEKTSDYSTSESGGKISQSFGAGSVKSD